jgi:hypothetical protein
MTDARKVIWLDRMRESLQHETSEKLRVADEWKRDRDLLFAILPPAGAPFPMEARQAWLTLCRWLFARYCRDEWPRAEADVRNRDHTYLW